MAVSTIQTRVDTTLKNNAEQVLSSIGLDMTSAIRLFLSQVVNQKKIPFEAVASPELTLNNCNFEDLNAETQQALTEARQIENGTAKKAKTYKSFDEILNERNVTSDQTGF